MTSVYTPVRPSTLDEEDWAAIERRNRWNRREKYIWRDDPVGWLDDITLFGTRKRKKLMHNTWVEYARTYAEDGDAVRRFGIPAGAAVDWYHIRLYRTIVVAHAVVRSSDRHFVFFDTGGYRTVTTKDRMNRFGYPGVSVYQRNWEWYCEHRESGFTHRFDGPGSAMLFTLDGRIITSATH